MITANDLRNGMIIEFEGRLYQIVEFQHVKPGKGGAFVRGKLKDVKSGSVLDRTFRSRDSFEQIHLEDKEYQFLYSDEGKFYFMDIQTYEQIAFLPDHVGDKKGFLKEGLKVKIFFYRDKSDRSGELTPLEIELPNFVELKVVEAPPGVRGDTVSSPTKEATLETGYKIQVPLFIGQNDIIRVSTQTGKYVERA